MNEVVSTHGYSQNQIMVWKYPTMAKVNDRFPYVCFPSLSVLLQREVRLSIGYTFSQVATLTGHSLRVLYLAMSPDGQVSYILPYTSNF